MPWFRQFPDKQNLLGEKTPLAAEVIAHVISERMQPAHFFTGQGLVLVWEPAIAEEIPWEIFQGGLLDRAHTRLEHKFLAWNIYVLANGNRSAEPLLAIKWDPVRGVIHVMRSIFCFAWEGYHAGDNIYTSREVCKWIRELVGTISINRFTSGEELGDELSCRLFQAVVGTSRLPITSLEAPLPDFSLGALGYFFRPDLLDKNSNFPMQAPEDLLEKALHAQLARLEIVKLLELLLRTIAETALAETASQFAWRCRELGLVRDFPSLFRDLFREVALSPYTDFVSKTFAFLHHLKEQGLLTVEQQIDFFSFIIRQISRHLTAYDLTVFHHRGANYPDILLLDSALKKYLEMMQDRPENWVDAELDSDKMLASKRLRRRAVRQGWLLRRHYEGHPVPDRPTSVGENARILPSPHTRSPEEQILDPGKRHKRLFANDPLESYLHADSEYILANSIRDLHHSEELQELGMALFLDRPLGMSKKPTEPDQTPLLSYEAFSRSIAQHRLQELAGRCSLLGSVEAEIRREKLQNLRVAGVNPPIPKGTIAPGKVSLADAYKASRDFVIVRTTTRSAYDFLALLDFLPLDRRLVQELVGPGRRLLILQECEPGAEANLVILDENFRKRVELRVNSRLGFESRGGIEYPVGGLEVARYWAFP